MSSVTDHVPAKEKTVAKNHVGFKNPLGLAIDDLGEIAYVAQRAAGSVALVDLRKGRILKQIPVGKGPREVILHEKKVYVICESDDLLVVIDANVHAVQKRIKVGQAPRGLIIADNQVFVTCRDAGLLQWLEIGKDKLNQLRLPPFPERTFHDSVNHLLHVVSSHSGKARITTIQTKSTVRLLQTIELKETGNLSSIAFAAIPFKKATHVAFLAHQRPKSSIPTTQVSQGWIFTNALSIVPFDNEQRLWPQLPQVALLDEPSRGLANPADVICSDAERKVFVASAGSDSVVVLDCVKLFRWLIRVHRRPEKNAKLEKTYPFDKSAHDLTASRHFVTAQLATGANPRRLAMSRNGKLLVASNYLDDSLTLIDPQRLKVLRTIRLSDSKPNAARRGAILFNSAKMTFQRQFSCSSCHPDGGSDSLTWDLTRDGIGNFKKTKSLHGVKGTAPYGWHGSSPSLEDRITGTLRSLHRHEPEGSEVADLTSYLKSLPPPRPLPMSELNRPAVARGKAIFQSKGDCISCHRGQAFDDGKLHNIGTRGKTDTQDRFDTPSLLGVARTAPYLHDGRAQTLEDIFTKHNSKKTHGLVHLLSKQELADLIAYLKSL